MPVADNAANLYFNRDTKVYLVDGSIIWELPILGGYAFSQATNTSEITLSEMADSSNRTRRGRAMFTDSLAPAEWSFDTYVRPLRVAAGAHGAVEEILWANFVADSTATAGVSPALPTYAAAVAGAGTPRAPIVRTSTTEMDVTFDNSNALTLGTFDLVFVLGAQNADDANYELDGDTAIYRVNNCSVNEVSITFDIDGIATLSWSGMGSRVREEISVFDATTAITTANATLAAGISSTGNFIRNKLTALTITNNASSGVGAGAVYDITLTGGTITFTNNLSYLTPEVLGRVNTPLAGTTGTRSIGGSFTAYLDNKANGTMDLFENIQSTTDKTRNSHTITFYVGGRDGATERPKGPGIAFRFPNAHLSVPTHDTADVIAVGVDFTALPSTIGGTDECSWVRYVSG